MASAGSIFVDLLLRDANFASGMDRARRRTSNFSSTVQGDMSKARNSFASVISPIDNIGAAISRLSGILAGAFSVQKIVEYSDTWRQLEGRLSIISDGMGDVVRQQEALFEVAQRTRQPLEGITSFYTRLIQFVPEAERAQYDFLGVTESIATALAITGESGASASAAMIQFTQAIGTNFEAAGQELRSLQEQAPRLTKALVDALGGGTMSLQQMKDEGILTRESVLNALAAMGTEGQNLRAEFENVSLTVGQAFQRLDNAFLKYIGQSESVRGGTTSIAMAINLLAENLSRIVDVIILVSAAWGIKFVGSLVAANAAMAITTIRTVGLSGAMALLLGTSPAVIAALNATTVATLALNTALLPIGGLIGAVTIALGGVIFYVGGFKNALEGLVATLTVVGAKIMQVANYASVLGGKSLAEIKAFNAEIQKAADTKILGIANEREARNPVMPTFNPTTIPQMSVAAPIKENKKEIKELNSLYEKNKSLITGLSKETLSYNQTVAELNTLLENNKITNGEYSAAIERLNADFRNSGDQVSKWGTNITQLTNRAAQNMESAFADFLFDPFEGGLKGMLKSWVDTLRRMAAEAAASRLFEALGTKFGGSGGIGNILGSLFGGMGGVKSDIASSIALNSVGPNAFFADGGYLGPGQFGIAGEEGAELIYGGKTGVSVFNQDQLSGRGGNTYNIDARGADQAAIARLEQSLLALAGPGVIEQRVGNAQMRGML